LGGRRVEIQRPRACSTDGHELSLPSWGAWGAYDPLNERAFEQMVVGVSTRRYARSLEPLPQEIGVRGISKSAVSERFVVGTQRRLAELMRRDLSGLKLVALLIDGVHFASMWCWRRSASTAAAKNTRWDCARVPPRTRRRARRCWSI
jgi:hypothetical protein